MIHVNRRAIEVQSWPHNSCRSVLIFHLALFAGQHLTICGEGSLTGCETVVELVKKMPDGGGYNAKFTGSGTPDEIRFKDSRILSKSEGGTYCSGVTFAVAMKAAEKTNLLWNKSVADIKKFQREWYGSTDASAEKQSVTAMENLGIGKEVSLDDVRPGNFVQFWRGKSGHSAVFLEWVVEKDRKIGIRYWSSQSKTDGIGSRTEYFSDVVGKKGAVDRSRTYFGRLNSP